MKSDARWMIAGFALGFVLMMTHCSPAARWRRPVPESGAFAARVTDKYDCRGMGWGDPLCAPFFHPDVDPSYERVRLLFSYERACPVGPEDMVMVHEGDDFPCRWRTAR